MRVLILGAGISGHTSALLLRKYLGRQHEVVVVSPNKMWNWIPSNIWVGIGEMKPEEVTFELKPIYDKQKIIFHQAKALEIHPEGDATQSKPYVTVEYTEDQRKNEKTTITYDYLINATGPRLNFGATPGLGPDGFTQSVCTVDHAKHTSAQFDLLVDEMKKGHKKTIVIGTGHGTCTCQGAAFEFIFNLEFELRQRGVRDQAQLIYLTNEAELGDFGVGGMHLKAEGFIHPSKIFAESLFIERKVDWIVGAHVSKIEKEKMEYETLDGEKHQLNYDFAMLIPPFSGVPLKAFDKNSVEITPQLFNAGGFMKVDADYNPKPFDEWSSEDWPKTYQTTYKNIFAIGIAFAPPHQISRPRKTKNGTMIAPAPPRTGMPSAIMGRVVAQSLADMINGVSSTPTHAASMAEIGAACVASAGASVLKGSAASMTMYPIVPDYQKYPEFGRSIDYTTGELGSAGHWIKKILHYAFLYKAKAKPFWWIIPE